MEWSSKQGLANPAKVKFAGYGISVFSECQLSEYLRSIVDKRETKVLYGHSFYSISITCKHPEIYEYGEKADLLVADGRPFYLLAKWSGLNLGHEISIPNLVFLVLELANIHNWGVFILGAGKANNKKAIENIKKTYPGITNIQGLDGYFNADIESTIINKINSYKPNILLIGLPSPQKEKLAIEWKNKVKANIIIPCGGMIDVFAGSTRVTPPFIKKLGLASMFRLCQEPKRLFKRVFRMYFVIGFVFMPIYLFHRFVLFNKTFSYYLFCKKYSKNKL